MRLYAATGNAGKLREFADCGRGAAIEVLGLPGLAGLPEPVEDAVTFMANAELKAVAYSRAPQAAGLLVFADDSGLEVAALGGRPGVRSARFADDLGYDPGFEAARPDAAASRDDRNRRCLLSLLAELPAQTRARETGLEISGRGARFVCALALARDGELLLRAEGSVEGQIVEAPRGDRGFGYDPLFLVPAAGLTLAEMQPDQKWAVSHRGNAFRALLQELADSSL